MIRRASGAIVVTLTWIASAAHAYAEPLVTIICDKPNGFNIKYGVSSTERLKDKLNGHPELPKLKLRGPVPHAHSIPIGQS